MSENQSMNAKEAPSVEKMKQEIEFLAERNKKLEEELVAREELMLSLFSFIESNQKG